MPAKPQGTICPCCGRYNIPIKKHGTVRGYTNGCRCDECVEVHNSYYRDKRNNFVSNMRQAIKERRKG